MIFSKSMSLSAWEFIGHQLRCPTGLSGRLIGYAMEIANRKPNRTAIDALAIQATDRVLELGFGPGSAIKEMAALAPYGSVYGIDRSPVMLAQAKARNRQAVRAGKVALIQGTFDALPLCDASVDKVLAVNVAYFWNETGSALSEVRRVLCPGGLLSIYATDVSAMQSWKFAKPETHRTFSRSTLAQLLRDGGFDSDEIHVEQIRTTRSICGLVALARKS